MRISDWSSDVCSSDLTSDPQMVHSPWPNTAANAAWESGTPWSAAMPVHHAAGARWMAMNAKTKPYTISAAASQLMKRTPRRPKYSLIVSRSEEHTSELQSLMRISYAVFCLKKKKIHTTYYNIDDQKHNITKHNK